MVLCLEVVGGIRREEPPETMWVLAIAKGRGAGRVLGAVARIKGPASRSRSNLSLKWA